jgi:anti-sigma B factor antagonist
LAKLDINTFQKEINNLNVTVVDVNGIIDGSTVGLLEEKFASIKKPGGLYLFDFTDLEYISSAGIGFFMKEFDAVKEMNGKIVLMNLSPRVTRIFELLDLINFFYISSTEEEAFTVFTTK